MQMSRPEPNNRFSKVRTTAPRLEQIVVRRAQANHMGMGNRNGPIDIICMANRLNGLARTRSPLDLLASPVKAPSVFYDIPLP